MILNNAISETRRVGMVSVFRVSTCSDVITGDAGSSIPANFGTTFNTYTCGPHLQWRIQYTFTGKDEISHVNFRRLYLQLEHRLRH